MLQFCLALQQSPSSFTQFVYDNINNEQILPLISQQQFLSKLELKLTKVQHAQFFIKNIFKIIREPHQQELKVLTQFMDNTSNLNLKKITYQLIEGFQKKQLSMLNILRKINKDIRAKNNVEVQIALKAKVEPNLQNLMVLLRFLFQTNQKREWSNKEYRTQLNQLISQAFQTLNKHFQIEDQYLLIVSQLFHQSVTNTQTQVYFTLFLHNLLPKYKKQVIRVIKNLKNAEQDLIFSNIVVSRGVFHLFSRIFDTQTYFDQQLQLNIQNIQKIAQQFYYYLEQDIQIFELGWLTIFSLDKVILIQQFQQKLHICASILREVYNQRTDLVSQIYTLVICNYIQKIMIKDHSQKLQSILLILTPSELKYLIFKLNSILSEDKKLQIIQQGLKHPNKLLNACVIYFVKELDSKIITQEIGQFQYKFKQQYQNLLSQILIDRYNTYEKQLEHFIKWHIFKVSNQISHFQIQENVNLSALLSFYKHLFEKDYFAQQFWINQEKMEIFHCLNQPDAEKIDTFCQFFQKNPYANLSEIMLLTTLLRRFLQTSKSKLTQLWLNRFLNYASKALQILEKDNIPSNLIISLEFLQILLKHELLYLKQNMKGFSRLLQVLKLPKWKVIQQAKDYGRINFSIQYIVLKIIQIGKESTHLQQYKSLLPCYYIFILDNGKTQSSNSYTQKMMAYYKQTKFSTSLRSFYFRQLDIKSQLKEIICNYPQILSLKLAIKKSSQYFVFQSPTYKEEIVTFTYISQDPADNYYFKNHYLTFLYQEYFKVFTKAVQKSQQRSLANQLFQISLGLLQEILKGDTFTHSANFYKSLIKGQNLMILLSNSILSLLDIQRLQKLLQECLLIIQKDNYPLLRQYVQVVFCRAYLALNKANSNNNNRKLLLSMMKVNVNIGVPIALTLGYQLLNFSRSQSLKDPKNQITEIHKMLVKFISCHTAYLRGICQYYLHIYLTLVPPSDPFLANINKFWTEDKDSQKMLANISTVVQGFKEAVQNQCDFLGFERVQQFPSNRVKLQFYRSVCRFYNESILGQIAYNDIVDEKFYLEYCSSAQQRAKQVKKYYLTLLQVYLKYPNQRCHKNNMKLKAKQQEPHAQKNQKKQKKQNAKKNKGKDKSKSNIIKQEETKILSETNQLSSKLEHIFQIFSELDELISWNRRNHDPKVIVIATLLQKVHNFGHILRTLNGQKAMIVVPSKLPLEHAQCKELVPEKCDVQIIQIKQRDLQKFIVLMKKLGYPLVALQQCSRSVKVQEAQFPQKFMLLLGNERLGAPAALLNEGDLLVQIPQVGKIRSLNVHVSMVICLWQFLTKY